MGNSLLSPQELEQLQRQMRDPQKRLSALQFINTLIDDFERSFAQDQYKKQVEQKDASLLVRLKKFLTS